MPTPFYIRTAEGETYDVETLEEALEQFTSENGYRLTLRVPGIDVVIRRENVMIAREVEFPGQEVYPANITIRKKP